MAGTDSVLNLKINTIMDVSDVKHNVDEIQKSFSKLKLPDKLGDSLKKNISDFNKEYEKYQRKVAEGIHTQGDKNAVNKSLNSMLNSYEKIINEFSKMSKKDFKDIFNLDTGAFEKVQTKIKQIQAEIKKIKLDPKGITEPINQIRKLTSAKSLFGEGKGLNKLTEAFKTNDLLKAKEAIKEVDTYLARFGSRMNPEKLAKIHTYFDPLKQRVLEADKAAEGFVVDLDKMNAELNETGAKGQREFQGLVEGLEKTKVGAESLTEELKRQHDQEFNFNQEIKNIDRQVQSYFGLSQVIRKVGNIARDAFSTVKELDAAMVETAVVTNFDVGDMWDMLPMYTENANALGSTIKDVYEAATLYYQQGLNQAQAMGLANETLKMARIGGLEAAEATDMMTAALRGFNMQINELSAQRINDVYSELAAITASNTKEIGSAMERTASIANSAHMEFETTSAFLAQMIETTREAPENLGTAMKTIIARFQEMKQDPTKLIDSEGVMLDANRVDTALKTIGVNLMNTRGEFRDLDDVFLDIAAKWDSLSQGQQRYIATIAAGSRQQSRFIAMMSNYDRTMELVEAANNSAGASQRQFEKTLEGMGAKLNKLKNAWDQFAMGLMNNQLIKFGVDALTKGLTVVNKFVEILGKPFPDPFGGMVKSIATLALTLGGLNIAKKGVTGLITGGINWWQGDKSLFGKTSDLFKSGLSGGQSYINGAKQAISKGSLSEAIHRAYDAKFNKSQYENTFGAAFGQFKGSDIATAISQEIEATGSSKIKASLEDVIIRAVNEIPSDKIAAEEAEELKNGLINGLSTGMDPSVARLRLKSYGVDLNNMGVNKLPTKQLDEFQNKVGRAGSTLMQFGQLLRNTPFAPFGAALSGLGQVLMTFGTALTSVAKSEVITAFTTQGLVAGFTALGARVKALWLDFLKSPLAPIVAAMLALAAATWLVYRAVTANDRKLKEMSAAAGAAGDAYSSAKQATSELADNINRIKEADAGFDGLVAGTAAFNEQLVESNQLILDLINKYPMLNDYLTVDRNGRMKISDEGMEAVTEYQKQVQAQAAALSVEKNAALEAEKTRQEIEKLRGDQTVTIREHGEEYTYTYAKELTEEEQRQLDILEKQYESQKQSAALNSARTVISGKELANQEAVAGLYASQYESLKKQVTLGSKKENYEKYAEFYGYSYEGGKLLDIEGNEVNVDYDEIEDAIPDITVMMDFEANAESVDDAIASVNDLFAEGLESDMPGGDTFISDILSNNIEANEDLIQSVLKDDSQIVAAVQQMSAENLATLLNVDKATVENNISKYQDELIDLIHDNAVNIGQAQAEEYTDLATMMSEAQYSSRSKYRKSVAPGSSVVEDVTKQLETLTAKQRRSILQAGQGLQEAAGRDSMRIIVGGMTDLYTQVQSGVEGAQAAADELQSTIDGVNWSSAIERLGAYRDMAASSTESIREMGEALLNSSDSSNLLTDAFEEMFDSEDFQKLIEDADNLGKFTGNDIMDMADKSHILKKYLDETGISASGAARLINALTDSGTIGMGDLNDSILILIDHFSQLDQVMTSAHQTVSTFDEGVDTGEGEDFIKERYSKINELVQNGEYGNEQLLKNVEFIFGEDNWKSILENNDNNIQKALNSVQSDIELFKNGYKDAWTRLANNDDLDPENLVEFDENGGIQLNINGKSTDEIVDYLVEHLTGPTGQKYSRENMELALAAYVNNSPNARYELEGGNIISGFADAGYLETRRNAQNDLTVTRTELQTIASLIGKTDDEVLAAIMQSAGIQKDQVNVLENIDSQTKEASVNYKQLADEYSKNFVSDKASGNDWVKEYQKTVGGENKIDLTTAISDIQSRGLTNDQAIGIAYQAFKDNDTNATFEYEGRKLDPTEIKTQQDFINALQEFEEKSEWTQIGEAIAEGYLGYMSEHDTDGDGKPDKPSKTKPYGMTKEAEEEGNKKVESGQTTRGGQGVGNSTQSQKVEQDIKKDREEKTTKLIEIQTKLNEEGFTDASQRVEEFKDEVAQNPGEIGIVTKNIDPTKLWDYVNTVKEANPEVTVLSNTDYVYLETDGAIQYIDKQTGEITVIAKGFSSIYDEIDRIKNTVINIKVNASSSKPSNASEAHTGVNNKIPVSHVPEAGSLAGGIKKGKVGPKGQGGLTLTGELGYEIGWIPSEGRSVILGANGPQMVNLPKDAVVYNHEQSKDIIKKRKTIEAGSQAWNGSATAWGGGGWSGSSGSSKGSSSSSGSSKGSNSSKSDSKEEKHITINNFSIEEVIRFDIERKIENYQNKVDNWMKSLDKSLGKIGVKVSDVTSNINNQISYLKSVKNQNDNLAASYQRSLKELDTGNYTTTISYDNNGESKQEDVNLSPYIYKDQWGNYQIDQSKIKNAGSKQRQEAIFKAAESALSSLVSGLIGAQNAAQEAADAIEELQKKVYDTFWGWKNEITEIYNLSQKLSVYDAQRNRFSAQVALESARIATGFSDIASSFTNATAALKRNNDTIKEQIKANRDMVAARERDLNNAISATDELQFYTAVWKNNGKDSNNAAVKEAKKQYDAALLMRNYVPEDEEHITRNKDGSINYNIDWEQLENDRLNGKISQETYNLIKEQLDHLEESATSFNDAVKDGTELLSSIYEQLLEYQKAVADLEDELLKELEKELQEEIDSSKKLNDTIKNSLKDLLDEVKRKLDERRQKEDNEKTERDLANKQQRLALLRASTSGSQVEIAQLEKELADAEQSYQRTLEDQLLNKLQQQGDAAAKQRERQIAIAEAQLEMSSSSNKALVSLWLSDPIAYQDAIAQALRGSRGYDEKGEYGQIVLDNEIKKDILEVGEAVHEIKEGMNTVANEVENGMGSDDSDDNYRENSILKDFTYRNTNDEEGANPANWTTAKAFKDAGNPVKEAQDTGKSQGRYYIGADGKKYAGFSFSELKQGGYSNAQLRVGGYGLADFWANNIVKAVDLKAAGFTAKQLLDFVINGKHPYTTSNLKGIYTDAELGIKTSTSSSSSKTSTSTTKTLTNDDIVGIASAIWNWGSSASGWGYDQTRWNNIDRIFGAGAGQKVQDYINAHAASDSGWYSIEKSKKYFRNKYKKGGLAPFTGPAWLDGTKSKPELVLNATDTKNFIQLKDILSSVMKCGAFDTAAAVAGDTNYEININVDHINNDYDVDKIANRVKKIIVQDSSYRNVTSVRKFR